MISASLTFFRYARNPVRVLLFLARILRVVFVDRLYISDRHDEPTRFGFRSEGNGSFSVWMPGAFLTCSWFERDRQQSA